MSEPRVFKSFNIHKAYEKLLCERRDLQVENKALKERVEFEGNVNKRLFVKNEVLQESNNELLNLLPDSATDDDWDWCWNELFDNSQQAVKLGRQKAEALKEKESNG